MRVKAISVLVALAAAMVSLGAVANAAPPANGCPAAPKEWNNQPAGGWFLAHPIGDDAKFDKNGDGWICVKGVPGDGNSVTFVGGFEGATVKDNNGPG